jgi:hypothetical protein
MKSAVFVCLVLAGCATTNKNGPAAGKTAQSDDNMVCHEESDTGSMFTHTVCKPREEAQQDTDATRRALQNPKATRDMPTTQGTRAAGPSR